MFLEQLVVLVFLLLVLQLQELPLGLLEFPLLEYWNSFVVSSFTGLDKSLTATVWSSTVTWFLLSSRLAVASVAPA